MREGRSSGRRLDAAAAALRRLTVPVIGRVEKGALVLDLRCLDDEEALVSGFTHLDAITALAEEPAA
jgi:L-seryl-tRNA(Ser) seleniumtransferase